MKNIIKLTFGEILEDKSLDTIIWESHDVDMTVEDGNGEK